MRRAPWPEPAAIGAGGKVVDLQRLDAELPAERGPRDRVHPADGAQPKQLEVLPQVIFERQHIDRQWRQVGARVGRFDNHGRTGHGMIGRHLADEHRLGHPDGRLHRDGRLDAPGDLLEQRGAVRPAQGEAVELEEGVTGLIRGGDLRRDPVQHGKQARADLRGGDLINGLEDGIGRDLLRLVEGFALSHPERARLGRGGDHRPALVREPAENQWLAAQGGLGQPGGDQRRMRRANTGDHGIGYGISQRACRPGGASRFFITVASTCNPWRSPSRRKTQALRWNARIKLA